MIFKGCPHYIHDTKSLLTKKLQVSFHSFPLKDEVWFCQLDIYTYRLRMHSIKE